MIEREIAEMRLGEFSDQGSRGLQFLKRMFPGPDLTRDSMYSFATILGALTNVPLERAFSRRKALLIKWFGDYCHSFEPFLRFIELVV
jgi:hypothetical protein